MTNDEYRRHRAVELILYLAIGRVCPGMLIEQIQRQYPALTEAQAVEELKLALLRDMGDVPDPFTVAVHRLIFEHFYHGESFTHEIATPHLEHFARMAEALRD
jgi:hypothetical protein